jgi:hypothetical protein
MRFWLLLGLLCACALCACGSRSDVTRSLDSGPASPVADELCNGFDDDADSKVDEGFRDELGRYVADAHCGRCGLRCVARGDEVLEAQCGVIAGAPACIATRCAEGLGPTRAGGCAPRDTHLCLPCAEDTDCGLLRDARCERIGGESRCSVPCELGCAPGYGCDRESGSCLPLGGSCSCFEGQSFELACVPDETVVVPGEPLCVGRALCDDGALSSCSVGDEICDERDNDCDGQVDEGFVDERGVYSLSDDHCGQCGTSCREDTGTELELVCGGDPFAPRCVLSCPDARDGIQPGDTLDGDLDIGSGCECVVTSVRDQPGPVGAEGELLDLNCDGADGVVVESFYVAADGDDSFPGSPTRPLRTLAEALTRARESLSTGAPRPNVFVASGSYTETLELPDGVRVYGGYRRDFRALDPDAFLVEVRAPFGADAPGGAALYAVDVGAMPTEVAWLSLRGFDATADEQATFGGYLERPKRNLTLRGLRIYAGVPGQGRDGGDASAGSGPSSQAGEGAAPRGALENGQNQCVERPQNRVAGGAGGQNRCNGIDVRGGAGGTARCPDGGSATAQPSGEAGSTAIGTGGAGGRGGQDAEGPITQSCPTDVCCGLADFMVPSDFTGAAVGGNGRDGDAGRAGGGCANPRGNFPGGLWSGGRGSAGGDGAPGAGGGGGGAGGGVEMGFIAGICPYADGLGGGGGGGGAGGCGGGGGTAGTSGAPSIALFLLAPEAFTIEDVTFSPAAGGRGGRGGAGGAGGQGGAGGFGGQLAPSQRTTPTLAGTSPGARGGRGGNGGAGGGGGGGCGGSSVGIWIAGSAPASLPAFRAANDFELSAGGLGGPGGGGARVGGAGARGEAIDVVVQAGVQ